MYRHWDNHFKSKSFVLRQLNLRGFIDFILLISKKTIFGKKKNFDGEKLVELILRHQKASEFVVKRFWSEFVSLDPIPQEALIHWSDAFRKMNYEISELLAVILNSSYFWDEKYHVYPKLAKKIRCGKYQVPQVWSQLTHTADQVNPKKLRLSATCQLGLC